MLCFESIDKANEFESWKVGRLKQKLELFEGETEDEEEKEDEDEDEEAVERFLLMKELGKENGFHQARLFPISPTADPPYSPPFLPPHNPLSSFFFNTSSIHHFILRIRNPSGRRKMSCLSISEDERKRREGGREGRRDSFAVGRFL